MFSGLIHALRPDLSAAFCAAQLPGKNHIESFDLLLCPLDTRAHHRGREAALEAQDRVVDKGKVYK